MLSTLLKTPLDESQTPVRQQCEANRFDCAPPYTEFCSRKRIYFEILVRCCASTRSKTKKKKKIILSQKYKTGGKLKFTIPLRFFFSSVVFSFLNKLTTYIDAKFSHFFIFVCFTLHLFQQTIIGLIPLYASL